MTGESILKGIAQFVLERLMDFVLGIVLVSIMFAVSSTLITGSGRGFTVFSDFAEAVQTAALLIIIFYSYGGFIVTVVIHNFLTRKASVRKRLLALCLAYAVHFLIFPILIFNQIVFDDAELTSVTLASFFGGLATILTVNTIGTGFLRKLLKIEIQVPQKVA